MIPQPPPGQGPIDPRGAFTPPPPPSGRAPMMPPPNMMPPPGMFPPGGFGPPPMFMQPPPPKGGGFARAIFMTLATTIFGISLALNVYLLLLHGVMGGSTSARENSVTEGDPTQKIAVIPISGAIMEAEAAQFERFITAAEHDSNVKALVLEIDSPGGSVSDSDEIYHRVMQFKKNRAGVPVVVTMGGLAASGGYYVACAGDYIFAEPTTLTGNIGVLMPRFNISKLFEKWGIEETTIASTGARFKNAGSMFKPENAEDVAYIQDIADKAFTQFKDVVKAGRKFDQATIDRLADGRVYLAGDAKVEKLVDAIGYAKDAYDYAAKTAGLSKMTVVKYQDPPSFRDILMSSKSNVEKPGVTINGISVDAKGITELTTPRMMYLWRGE